MKNVAKHVVFALALVFSVAASAQESSSTSALPPNWAAQAYLDIGFHLTSVSDVVSESSGDFGLTLGGKATYRLSDNLSVGPLVNISMIFGDFENTAVPFTFAGVATLDKVLPVELSAGLGFTLLTGLTGATPSGLAILAQAFYPLPSMPNLGIHGQVTENILSSSTNLFQLTAGIGYKF